MMYSRKHDHCKEQIFLLFLFGVSLFIRLFFNWFFLTDNPCQLMYDSGQYHAVATSLAAGNGFTNGDDDRSPHFYRLPGYPLFLSLVYRMFGIKPGYALFIQILFSSFIPLLVYWLFLVFFPGNMLGARCAGVLASGHVGFIIFSGIMMTETFFLIFFLLFSLMFFSGNRYFWAGIFLGLASLLRPVGHYLVIVTVLIMMIQSKKIRDMLLLIAGWFIIVAPWLIRNFLITGVLFFHTLSGPHFLNHGATRVVMMHDKISYEHAKEQVHQKYDALLALHQGSLDEVTRSQIAEKLAFKIMLGYPIESLTLWVTNMLKTVFSLYSSELLMIDSAGKLPPYQNNRSFIQMLKRFLAPAVTNQWIILVIYVELLFFLLMLCATLHFLVSLVFDWQRFMQFMPLILFSGLFIALSCVCGFARLRFALEPFLLIFTGYFLQNFLVCFDSTQVFCPTQCCR